MRGAAASGILAVRKRAAPRNRMREILTSGSVGGLAEKSLVLPGRYIVFLWSLRRQKRCEHELRDVTLPLGESGYQARRGPLPGRYRVRPSRRREGYRIAQLLKRRGN